MKFHFLLLCMFINLPVFYSQVLTADTSKPRNDSITTGILITADTNLVRTTAIAFQNQSYYADERPYVPVVGWNCVCCACWNNMANNALNLQLLPVYPGSQKDTIPIPGKADILSCVHHPAIARYIPVPEILPAEKKEPAGRWNIIAGIVAFCFPGMIFLIRRIRKK